MVRLAAALPVGAGAVTLTTALQTDYETVVDRLLGIWHHSDPLAGFSYRGGP